MYRQLLVTSRCSASNETRRDFSTLAGGLKFSAQSQWLRFMSWNSSYLSSACAGTIRCRLHRGTTWYNLSVDWQWHFFVQKKKHMLLFPNSKDRCLTCLIQTSWPLSALVAAQCLKCAQNTLPSDGKPQNPSVASQNLNSKTAQLQFCAPGMPICATTICRCAFTQMDGRKNVSI